MRRGYKRYTWHFGNTKEVEEKHTGNYGAPGQDRKRKKNPTPEDIARQNQWKRERDVRRLIKWNFTVQDYWVTFTYRKGECPSWDKMKSDIQKTIVQIRKRYKKQGWDLKYIYRMEIGKRGAGHVHILVNRMGNHSDSTDLILKDCWTKGHMNLKFLYEEGGYERLAEYITKEQESWEPENLKRYHTSRNMIRKEPDEKEINRRSIVDKKGHMNPVIPPKGYFVDPDSIRFGRNPITGYFYRHYTLVKLDRRI